MRLGHTGLTQDCRGVRSRDGKGIGAIRAKSRSHAEEDRQREQVDYV